MRSHGGSTTAPPRTPERAAPSCREGAAQEAACWETQAMKLSSPLPVDSAMVCPCPQTVAKSTLPT